MRRVIAAGSRLLHASNAHNPPASLSTTSRLYSSETITCTLFPGDGIGPEIADAVKTIFEAAKAPIDWDEQYIGKVADPRTNSMVTRENLDSVLVRHHFSMISTLLHDPYRSSCHARQPSKDTRLGPLLLLFDRPMSLTLLMLINLNDSIFSLVMCSSLCSRSPSAGSSQRILYYTRCACAAEAPSGFEGAHGNPHWQGPQVSELDTKEGAAVVC